MNIDDQNGFALKYHTGRKMKTVTVNELENDVHRWVELTGTDFGTKYEFNNDVYGITNDDVILDCDGSGLTDGDYETIAVRNSLGL